MDTGYGGGHGGVPGNRPWGPVALEAAGGPGGGGGALRFMSLPIESESGEARWSLVSCAARTLSFFFFFSVE